jgi:hypothetical protein
LATSLGNGEGEKYLKRAESELEELKQQKGMQNQLAEQIDVVRSRVLCLRDEKREAEKLMKDRSASIEGLSMEDSLDKMKAFHELGMREHCVSILDKLRKQIEGDTFTSQVVNEYLNQESIERTEIQFTTKELKQMAAVNYKENRLIPAYNNLRQALTLSPKDKQIALSLLKVIAQMHLDTGLSEEQMNSAKRAAKLLCDGELSATQAEKRDQYIARIGVEVDSSNAADLVGMVAVKP